MKRKRTEEGTSIFPRDNTKMIVLNKCFGGFGMSEIATHALMERLGYVSYDDREARRVLDMIERDNPILIQVIREFGAHAWFPSCENTWIHKPVLVEIPNIDYEIVWNDGFELAVPVSFERPIGPF